MVSVKFVYQGIIDFYRELNKSQKLYFVSAIFFTVQFFTKYLPEPANKTFFSLAMIFLVWAVINDLLALYHTLWNTPLGKGILLLGYTFLANLSLSLGAQYVNNSVGVEPYLYKHSIVFAAIMSVPVVAALVAAVAWLVAIVFGSIYLLFGLNIQQASDAGLLKDVLPKNSEIHPFITTIVRVLAIGLVCYFAYNLFAGYNERYNDFVVKQTKAFLYHFEALEHSRCKIQGGSKFLPLNDKELIVASQNSAGNYVFKLEVCKPKLPRT
ncbi:hypothetical protein [Vibrio sp. CAU 1672]|uniref:hypothetical protein n=1 Tax=Vibrio sp. CAU 1672 TaxID=3032594 RepID=UPI0023DA4D0E|nr:hypothetical protein [Vibrio sp. CAU 1672]MDF2156097.1 hypothetical protein [Vibrio sp. CAU 1672]